MKMKNMRKKSVAILAGLAIAGTVGASAASLGGLGGNDLGADAAEVVSCDTDGVVLAYETSFDAATGEYEVDTVTVSSVNAACDGQDFGLTLTDGTNVLGTEATGQVALTAGSFSVTVDDGIAAELVTDAALVISGATV